MRPVYGLEEGTSSDGGGKSVVVCSLSAADDEGPAEDVGGVAAIVIKFADEEGKQEIWTLFWLIIRTLISPASKKPRIWKNVQNLGTLGWFWLWSYLGSKGPDSDVKLRLRPSDWPIAPVYIYALANLS